MSQPVSTTEIRSQIEQTRAHIGQTIDEIHSRLTPGGLVAEATDAVKEATVGRVKRAWPGWQNVRRLAGDGSADLLGAISANPLSTAVAGAAATAAVLGARTWRRRRPGFRIGEVRPDRERPGRGSRRVGRRGKALLLLSAGLAWLMVRSSREYLREPVFDR
jgi:hypothetical protein